MRRDLTSGDLLADRRFLYGRALSREGDFAAAADLFAQTVERAPDWGAAWFALGEARARAGDAPGAAAAFQRASALDLDGRLGADLALAAVGAAETPGAAGEAYVAALFDDYAARFDAHLVEALAYRGPAILAGAVAAVAPGRRFSRALDLGCGTGLMGEAIRARVDRLDGVDLSPAMIAKAREKGLYDDLRVGDLGPALRAAAPLDLVLAADVLVYVGALGPTFAAVAAALRPDGLFAFTLQKAPGDAVVVGADLRFAHPPSHVRREAQAAGLRLASLDDVVTRRDGDRDTPGLAVVLARD